MYDSGFTLDAIECSIMTCLYSSSGLYFTSNLAAVTIEGTLGHRRLQYQPSLLYHSGF